MGWIWWAAAVLSFAVSLRVILICTSSRPSIKKRKAGETCRVAVFLGSGGHTSEMMQLLKALPPHRYNARTYILTTSDRFSMDKALEYEKSIASSIDSATDATAAANPSSFDFIQLPRARSVHQKWLSTPISVLIAFAVSVHQLVLLPTVLAPRKVLLPDAIIMNGPGTCVPIVAAVYILRVSEAMPLFSSSCNLTSTYLRRVICTSSVSQLDCKDSLSIRRRLSCAMGARYHIGSRLSRRLGMTLLLHCHYYC
jgi:beta-1,4-N-acetylglucosaminyltransferase